MTILESPATIEGIPRSRVQLKSSQFRREREATWTELESLLETAHHHGIRALTSDQRHRLPLLYRSVLSSLSVARSIALDRALILYLDNLALRAFLTVYAPHTSLRDGVRTFVLTDLPAAVRALRWHVLIMVAVLALGTVSGYSLVMASEGWFATIVPTTLANGRGPASSRDDLLAVLSGELPGPAALLDAIANQLFAHNTVVALLAFGTGILAGVPSVLFVFLQGIIAGAFLALHSNRHLTTEFVGWISIHGAAELSALVLFGAAGLRMGELVVFPGAFARDENLAQHGPLLGVVAVGGSIMLLAAAILEGVFRQVVLDTDLRIGIGVLSLMLWTAYFVLCKEDRPSGDGHAGTGRATR